MDWNNLRYFLELARTGTLAGAARRLGVEHTTVSRRIQALEKEVGEMLFAREAGGHRLTEAGRHLLPGVEAMEAAVLGVERLDAARHCGVLHTQPPCRACQRASACQLQKITQVVPVHGVVPLGWVCSAVAIDRRWVAQFQWTRCLNRF